MPEENHQAGAYLHTTLSVTAGLPLRVRRWASGQYTANRIKVAVYQGDRQLGALFAPLKWSKSKYAEPRLCPATCPEVLDHLVSELKWEVI